MNIVNSNTFTKRELFLKGKREFLKSPDSRRIRKEIDLGVDLYMVVDARGLPLVMTHGRQMAQLTCASPKLMRGMPGWRLLSNESKGCSTP